MRDFPFTQTCPPGNLLTFPQADLSMMRLGAQVTEDWEKLFVGQTMAQIDYIETKGDESTEVQFHFQQKKGQAAIWQLIPY